MTKLIRGEKVKLSQFLESLSLTVNVSIPVSNDSEIDIACFALDEQGHLSDDRYFIFYNQPTSPEGAIEKSQEDSTFTIDLSKLPNSLRKLVFTATIDSTDSMQCIGESSIALFDTMNTEQIHFDFNGTSFTEEKAIIIAEIYLVNNEWRFSIVNSGFIGGLEALLIHFGGEPDDSNTTPQPIEEAPELIINNPETVLENAVPPTPKKEKHRRPSIQKNRTKSVPPTNSRVLADDAFKEQIKDFMKRVESLSKNISSEEATKTTIIMPFFQIMGFDVFNPMEFCPEYVSDVGTKKGEKVDYAILINNEPIILIEAKPFREELSKHGSQLFRYFVASKARFAILTNGTQYEFYTDLDKDNVMDFTPFLEIDLFNLSESDYQELARFHKSNLDIKEILDSASELKYLSLITHTLKEDFANPSDDFVRYILGKDVYSGIKTQNTIDKFRPLIKKSVNEYIYEAVNEKIQNAFKNDSLLLSEMDAIVNLSEEENSADTTAIVTTQEELESYYIVKSILSEAIHVSRVTYKDTQSYFGINLDGKVTKWICRLVFRDKNSYAAIPDEQQKVKKYPFTALEDLYQLKNVLLARLKILL